MLWSTLLRKRGVVLSGPGAEGFAQHSILLGTPVSPLCQETHMTRNYMKELERNIGKVYLPNLESWKPNGDLLPFINNDILSYDEDELRSPRFEQEFAIMIKSAVFRDDCVNTDEGIAAFIRDHLRNRVKGKLVMWNEEPFDPNKVSDRWDVADRVEGVLGEDPGRTATRLMEKIEKPSKKRAPKRLLFRRCCYAWVWKAYAGRAGRTEFCKVTVR
jgi:hypothetical protein